MPSGFEYVTRMSLLKSRKRRLEWTQLAFTPPKGAPNSSSIFNETIVGAQAIPNRAQSAARNTYRIFKSVIGSSTHTARRPRRLRAEHARRTAQANRRFHPSQEGGSTSRADLKGLNIRRPLVKPNLEQPISTLYRRGRNAFHEL